MTELTIAILREIRDGVVQTNQRLDQTADRLDQRLDQTNQRLDQTNQRLDRVIDRLGRVENSVNDLGGLMRQIVLDQARHERFHMRHVTRLDETVADLSTRVERLESTRDRTEPSG